MVKEQTLFIKNPEAHQLAEQLSIRLKVSLTEAVILALRDQVKKPKRILDRAKIDDICAKFDALPVLDSRTPEEILGYDDHGLPS